VAYADGRVYVGTSHGGVIRCYAALDGGVPGLGAVPEWETDTGVSELAQYAGFYGGVTVHGGYVYAAAYQFYGTGNSSRMYKLAADDGRLIWEQPCERTDCIPVVAENGHIYLAAGIEGFGSAVKVQAFHDHGEHATQLWDTYVDTGGSLIVGGWTHQPLLSQGFLYCGTPDESQFFAPYTDFYILDVSRTPTDAGFVVDHATGSGGSPAAMGQFLYSLGSGGLVTYMHDDRGDLNCDGTVDLDDVAPFVLALTHPSEYATAYPACDVRRADMNDDTREDGLDIPGFVSRVLGS
jgi:outer membrane protein assembly factor BamB